MLRFRGFMDLRWDVVVITSAKEDACLSVVFTVMLDHIQRGITFECVVGINVLFCQDETHPGKTCIWAGIAHRDT